VALDGSVIVEGAALFKVAVYFYGKVPFSSDARFADYLSDGPMLEVMTHEAEPVGCHLGVAPGDVVSSA
jgi:hypothetical protein